MSRFKPEGRRHFKNIGSNYMGAGRTHESFTHGGKPAFAKMKQVFGINYNSTQTKAKPHKSLTDEEKDRLLEELKINRRKQLTKQIIVGIVAGIVSIAFIIWIGTHEGFHESLLNLR